jgi:HD-like signal output (HDOD) protein
MNIADPKAVALRAVDRLPLLPAVFQRTLALFAKGDEISVAELAGVVEQDVVIAGHLVSIANSAVYSRTSSVCSVRHAIARLGISKTRNALLGLSVSRPFRNIRLPRSWSSARFNSHSLAAAIWGDLLVQKIPVENAEWAFLTGLLHDVGLFAIATAFPEQSLEMADAGSDYQLAAWERQLLGFTHFEIGADVLKRWNCPAVVQDASVFCQSNAFELGNPMSLGMVVKTASLLADANGMSTFGSNHDPALAPDLLGALSLQNQAAFIEAFQTEYSCFHSCVAGERTLATR